MALRVRRHTRLLLTGESTAFERTIDASADPVQAAFEELVGGPSEFERAG